jgi:hypothetical protein
VSVCVFRYVYNARVFIRFFFSFESTRFFIILREWDPVATLRLACLLSLILFVYLFFISFQDQIRTRERERKKKTSLWPAHLLWSFFYHSRSRHTTNFSSFFFLSSYSNHDIYLYGLPPDEWEIGSQVWNDGQTSNVPHTHPTVLGFLASVTKRRWCKQTRGTAA